MSTLYTGRLAAGSYVELNVIGKRIDSVREVEPAADSPWLFPVLVDLQHNGSMGVAYNELHDDVAGKLPRVARHLRQHGVGRCWATLTTYPGDKLLCTAKALDQWLSAHPDENTLFTGIFHEGIFISPVAGWRGAHVPDWVRPPDIDYFHRIMEASGGRIRAVNVAPEQPGALTFIEQVVAAGVQIALGHAGPDAATVATAVARGATLVTHFGNGAPPQIHRHRNPLWSYLAHPELCLGLIGDGFHLPPDLVRAALAAKTERRCFLVSDASGHAGMPPGTYRRAGGAEFVITAEGYMHLVDSEILSGAWFQLDAGVEFLVRHLGFDLPAAWRLCSQIPARIAGIDLPDLSAGSEASFVVAHWDDGLVLDQCVHGGEPYLAAPLRARAEGIHPPSRVESGYYG